MRYQPDVGAAHHDAASSDTSPNRSSPVTRSARYAASPARPLINKSRINYLQA
jgi:hypothetical protein